MTASGREGESRINQNREKQGYEATQKGVGGMGTGGQSKSKHFRKQHFV